MDKIITILLAITAVYTLYAVMTSNNLFIG